MITVGKSLALVLITVLLFSSCSYFYDSTEYSKVDKPFLGTYNKNSLYENCPETITLLNDSLYVRELICPEITILDTAKYIFILEEEFDDLNRMRISFKDWRYLYDDISYANIDVDSIGTYGCFYTVENHNSAKFVIHGDLRYLDYVLELPK